MSSHVVTIKEGVNIKKQTRTKIGVVSVVKSKVGDLGGITREDRIGRISE